jgi:hypothetical protein
MVMKVTVDRVMSDWPLNQIDPNNNNKKTNKKTNKKIKKKKDVAIKQRAKNSISISYYI